MIWIIVCIPGSMELSGITYSIIQDGRNICVRTMDSLLHYVLTCIRTVYIVEGMLERLTRIFGAGVESII